MGTVMPAHLASRAVDAARAYIGTLAHAGEALRGATDTHIAERLGRRLVFDAMADLRSAIEGVRMLDTELGGTAVPAGSVQNARWALRTLDGTAGPHTERAVVRFAHLASGRGGDATRALLARQVDEARSIVDVARRQAEFALDAERLRMHRLPAGMDGARTGLSHADDAAPSGGVEMLPEMDAFDGTRFSDRMVNRDSHSGEELGDMIGWPNGHDGGSFDVPGGEFLG